MTEPSADNTDSTSAIEYCRQQIARPGSTFYYAVRFAPPPARVAMLGLFAMADALQDVAWSRDTEVAASRLHWWSEEMQRLWQGCPRHPITRCLAAGFPGLDPGPLIRCLEAVDAGLHSPDGIIPGASETHYHGAMWIEFMVMICRVLGDSSPHSDDFAGHLGTGHGLAEQLLNLGILVRRRPALLAPGLREYTTDTAALSRTVEEHAQMAGEAFAAARGQLPPDRYRNQLPLLVVAAIDESTLTEIDPRYAAEEQTRLTPLRRAWLALRTHRKVKQQEERT